MERIRALLHDCSLRFDADDIVVLPEAIEQREDLYRPMLERLARELGCHVVGGSRREQAQIGTVNSGLLFRPDGSVVGRYEKLCPYAGERDAVRPGRILGEFSIGGRNVLVLICADFFWLAKILRHATRPPDLILVAALSVTRKATPMYARAVWRHTAVARAYEYAAFIGISDWGFPSALGASFASGVGGLADPTAVEPRKLFQSVGAREVVAFSLDFPALAALRADRAARGFLNDSTPSFGT